MENKLPTKISDIPKTELIKGSIAAVILIAGVLYGYNLEHRLSKKPAYTKGIIVDKEFPWKGLPYIISNFEVDGIIYRSDNRYSSHLQEINIGDTCYVKYEEDNPENNNLLRSEEDKRLFKIKKPDDQ